AMKAIASSQPTTKPTARRRPEGIVSRTITVTTETGLERAMPNPRARTLRISVCKTRADSDGVKRVARRFDARVVVLGADLGGDAEPVELTPDDVIRVGDREDDVAL